MKLVNSYAGFHFKVSKVVSTSNPITDIGFVDSCVRKSFPNEVIRLIL